MENAGTEMRNDVKPRVPKADTVQACVAEEKFTMPAFVLKFSSCRRPMAKPENWLPESESGGTAKSDCETVPCGLGQPSAGGWLVQTRVKPSIRPFGSAFPSESTA